MNEEKIIRVQYEAIKKYCQGDRKLALRVIGELGADLRDYILSKLPDVVTSDELCVVIEEATRDWKNPS